jgi:ribonuclease T1
MMRRLTALAVACLLLAAGALVILGQPGGGPGVGERPGPIAALAAFDDPAGVQAVIETVRQTGRLPDHYVTKREAEALGWRPGSDLCDVAQGRVIGGDRFQNREGRLPDAQGRRWFEADLDFACGRRGAKRLVYSSDGLIYLTVDHYESFVEVPD